MKTIYLALTLLLALSLIAFPIAVTDLKVTQETATLQRRTFAADEGLSYRFSPNDPGSGGGGGGVHS